MKIMTKGRSYLLPFHHRDPSDRVLAAQHLIEGMAIIGSDEIFTGYGIKRAW
jgi:PIN domain nuclease of toxin-antitoxin system